ncbi:MAG TPA: phosphoribosylformylglycinamidine synthase subunit PurQ [Candidatus Nanopelagicaceae bacterium]
MRIGVVTFPGSLDDSSALRAIRVAGGTPVPLFHASDDLREVEAVVLPGGFSYGDYLRCGAISRFAPIMSSIIIAAEHGFPVLGICNGFQILCESHLLPGALTRNEGLHFVCTDQPLIIENVSTPWTSGYTKGDRLVIPIKNGEGSFQASAQTLAELESEGRVVLRYADKNPNGSKNDIAGIANARGNVVGVMPHPEQAIESLTGPSIDGLKFFTSVLQSLVGR